MVADDVGQRTAEAVESHDHHHVASTGVVRQRREARAVVADPEELVGEQALATGCGQRVTLLVAGLLVGADPSVGGS